MLPVMKLKWGDLEVSTCSEKCIDAINNYFDQVLGNGRENHCIKAAPNHDPNCVLANTLAAYVTFYGDRTDASALRYLSAAQKNVTSDKATSYEKAVFEAVKCFVETGDDDKAVDMHKELLKEFPEDILSLKRVQVLCFFMGGSEKFLEIVEEVLRLLRLRPDNKVDKTNYLHGIHAFALQEVGKDMKAAERAGDKGYEINHSDAATHHALCHIYQHECHFRRAVDFMKRNAKEWVDLQAFMVTHNWWHVSLCYLEGNAPIKYVWEIHEKYLWAQMEKEKEGARSRGKVYLNDIGLLLRVHVRESYNGVLRDHYEPSMLKKRLDTLTESLMKDLQYIRNREWFVDILVLWVLSHMGKYDEAHKLLEDLKIKMDDEKHPKKKERMRKGLELAKASYYYGKREYEEALKHLEPDFDAVNYKVIGASGEQIDVFNEVYIDMLLKTKRGEDAVLFILKQLDGRIGAPFLWHLGSEAIKVVDGEGNSETTKNNLKKLAGELAEASKVFEAFGCLT